LVDLLNQTLLNLTLSVQVLLNATTRRDVTGAIVGMRPHSLLQYRA